MTFCFLSILKFTVPVPSPNSLPSSNNYFCYNKPECGPSTWGPVCSTGNEKRQSPINLSVDPRCNSTLYPNSELSFSKAYYKTQKYFFIRNNGHTVQIQLNEDATSKLSFTGTGLKGSYVLSQIHFHWGLEDEIGSEHTVNNIQFPAEIHLVHYSSAYRSLDLALEDDNSEALAVLGIFLQVSQTNTTYVSSPEEKLSFQSLFRGIKTIGSRNSSDANPSAFRQVKKPLRVIDLLPLTNSSSGNNNFIFRYAGSLTTPNCLEKVVWSIFNTMKYVSPSQLRILRNLQNSNGDFVGNNFRPIQPLAGRKVRYYSVDPNEFMLKGST